MVLELVISFYLKDLNDLKLNHFKEVCIFIRLTQEFVLEQLL